MNFGELGRERKDACRMNEENVIRFKMLGPFSHVLPDGEDPLVQSVSLKAGKKTLSFLQYLIMNHARDVSSEELIEQFWPEGSRAPEVALRQTLFKVRNVLERMFLEKSDLLITLPGGGYTWNHDVFLELDVERFEEACLNARRTLGEEKCELLLQAVSLYKGEFLSGNDNEWARVLRQYYQTLYLDACKILLPLLYGREMGGDFEHMRPGVSCGFYRRGFHGISNAGVLLYV